LVFATGSATKRPCTVGSVLVQSSLPPQRGERGSIDVVQLQLQVGSMFSALGAAERSLPLLKAAYEEARGSPSAAGMVPRIARAIASSHHRLGQAEERQRWIAIAVQAETGR